MASEPTSTTHPQGAVHHRLARVRDHRRDVVGGVLRAAFRQGERRGGVAHPGAPAHFGVEGVERGGRLRRRARQNLRLHDPTANLHGRTCCRASEGRIRFAARNHASASSNRPRPSRTKACA